MRRPTKDMLERLCGRKDLHVARTDAKGYLCASGWKVRCNLAKKKKKEERVQSRQAVPCGGKKKLPPIFPPHFRTAAAARANEAAIDCPDSGIPDQFGEPCLTRGCGPHHRLHKKGGRRVPAQSRAQLPIATAHPNRTDEEK